MSQIIVAENSRVSAQGQSMQSYTAPKASSKRLSRWENKIESKLEISAQIVSESLGLRMA